MTSRQLNPATRAAATRPICAWCANHLGFCGPGSLITTCVRSVAPAQRISLATGLCPDGKWDARDMGGAPKVTAPPVPDAVGTHVHRLLALKDSGRGRILIVVANGPSHREAELDKLKDHPLIDVMAINKPDDRLWPPQFWAFVDESQAKRHRDRLASFNGVVFNSRAVKTVHPNAIMLKGSKRGFQTDLMHGVHVGGTTTHVALQLAAWMGYEHVYVFGVDLGRGDDGKLYAWGSNPDVNDERRESRFPRENKTLDAAGASMGSELRQRFTFCSSYAIEKKWSFLKHFEAISHAGAVDAILARHLNLVPRVSRAKSPLTLLCCTGERPAAFALCERWMARAIDRYGGDVEIIVVDDGPTPTLCTLGQRVIRPTPLWEPGQNTQARNMLAALQAVRTDRVCLIEDDDFYQPDYLRVMAEMLDRYAVVGEGAARYYNVRERRWRYMRNFEWAAACQTGLRAGFIPHLRKYLGRYNRFDINFWKGLAQDQKHLFFGKNLVVGIKGMPGRPGAASGHRPGPSYVNDPALDVLRSWIGADADVYAKFYASQQVKSGG